MGCKVQVVIITRRPLEQGFGRSFPDNHSSDARENLSDTANFAGRIGQVRG